MSASDQNATIWPSSHYQLQLTRLQQMIGQPVFVAEIAANGAPGVALTDQSVTLLAVIDFPRPDPYRQLYPHMLILDDGRGINLGHVARVSINRAFQPADEDLLFVHQDFVNHYLLAPRQLSRKFLTQRSQALLQRMLGDEPGHLLEQGAAESEEAARLSVDKQGDQSTNKQ